MVHDRRKSLLEELMVEILREENRPMTLAEIVQIIKRKRPSAITGRTPANSLYSVIYRNEKRRGERGEDLLFVKEYVKTDCLYSLKEKIENK